ncbi:TonB family protein [Hymenobacter sp. GOD-10R]|uniref:TonB family protein n=1 Tax=Hymenobacter sp. GOD-10R TaxID=3093922 RepID=UPI002D775597|nr:TonB family protein [Hymenobacter sp. GOD-10R]WRQ29303.1 TonB family protein [Hymenobacter sp. GOD-10R]
MQNAYCLAIVGALLTITPSLFAQSTSNPAATTTTSPVYTYVEQMPSFRGGGTDSVIAYIRHNTRYPAEALQTGAVGRVFVSFVVNAQGQVEQAQVLKGVHPALDQEALRVISTMPAAWQPGKKQGQPVSVALTMPINFAMQSQSKLLAPYANTNAGSAKYPGGPDALLAYLASAPYPEAARAAQAEGRVFIKFKLDATGKVIEARPLTAFEGTQQGKSKPRTINKQVGSTLEQAATQWISAMPAWTPVSKNGAPVASSAIILPVTFRLTPSASAEKVYPYADQMPVFKTLTDPTDILTKLQRAAKYPPMALRNKMQGDVYVYFEVNEAGALEKPEIVSSVGRELDDAVLAAVRSQHPAVAPAKQEGKPVKVFYVVPLSFHIM